MFSCAAQELIRTPSIEAEYRSYDLCVKQNAIEVKEPEYLFDDKSKAFIHQLFLFVDEAVLSSYAHE